MTNGTCCLLLADVMSGFPAAEAAKPDRRPVAGPALIEDEESYEFAKKKSIYISAVPLNEASF